MVLVVRDAREAAVEGAGDGDRLQRESQRAQPVDRQARLEVELHDRIEEICTRTLYVLVRKLTRTEDPKLTPHLKCRGLVTSSHVRTTKNTAAKKERLVWPEGNERRASFSREARLSGVPHCGSVT